MYPEPDAVARESAHFRTVEAAESADYCPHCDGWHEPSAPHYFDAWDPYGEPPEGE